MKESRGFVNIYGRHERKKQDAKFQQWTHLALTNLCSLGKFSDRSRAVVNS